MAEITELTNNTRLIDSVDIINGNFNNLNDGKQDAISDLDTIRNNASIGAGLATQVETNKSNIASLSSGKVNKSDVYTKTESNNLLGAKADKAKLSMPSATSVTISLAQNTNNTPDTWFNTTYTAVADGWCFMSCNGNYITDKVSVMTIDSRFAIKIMRPINIARQMDCYLPVSKGDPVVFGHINVPANAQVYGKFIYAKSEV